MRKVLIITYYWVPSGGAGVQRWVKFSKYLRDFGWEPVIYTPSNPEYPSIDNSFEKDIPTEVEVIKTPIWEPYNIYRNLLGKKGQSIPAGFITEDRKAGWKDRLSIWIRGNFLIPDPRCFWIRPSIHFLKDYLLKHPVDAVISTGPPHSMHLIAAGLKKHYPDLPWLADFRDPWTNIDFYQELGLTRWADHKHHRLERKVLKNADTVLVVSDDMKREFQTQTSTPIKVIHNGYDADDVQSHKGVTDTAFSISHIGTINAARNPVVLWKALSELCDEHPGFADDLCIQLVGKVDFSVIESIQAAGLTKQLLRIDYLSHAEAISKQQSSQLLLLLINRSNNAKGILTGKFFEYLASGRPIIGIGPEVGDAAAILNQTKAGEMVGFDDKQKAKTIVWDYYQLYRAGKLKLEPGSVATYSRRELTRQLSEIINQHVNHV